MMPAGKYFIGDLCYVMHDVWDEVCGFDFEGEFTLKDGRKAASFFTLHGDGSYSSNIGTTHCVDSGSIGCILVNDIRDDSYDDIEKLGAIVEFKNDFTVDADGGKLFFGHIVINTDFYDDNDDDYFEENE
jgi:hypothetical protein